MEKQIEKLMKKYGYFSIHQNVLYWNTGDTSERILLSDITSIEFFAEKAVLRSDKGTWMGYNEVTFTNETAILPEMENVVYFTRRAKWPESRKKRFIMKSWSSSVGRLTTARLTLWFSNTLPRKKRRLKMANANKATLVEMELRGKFGVGIYINGGLSKFFVNAIDLLEEIKALKTIGYDVKMERK
jgi:hypothetical protein